MRKTILAAAVATFLASPALADSFTIESPRSDDPEWVIGRLVYFNDLSPPSPTARRETLTREIPGWGPMHFGVVRTPNAGPNCRFPCPDTLTIIEMPVGVSAFALEMTVPEDSAYEFVLFDVDRFPMV